MGAIITLTSDFGLTDGYAAAMKGVILGINPDAQLVDISHAIDAQNIAAAAFVLGTACVHFPPGTVHLVVVDPGVGTEREGIALETPAACFVAPDNGVLSYVLRDYSCRDGRLVPGLRAVRLTKDRYWRSPVSSTFHGRDIFAPVAAHLSRGVPLADLGEFTETVQVLPVDGPRRGDDGSLIGSIIHIDRFGNLITNIGSDILSGAQADAVARVKDREIKGLSKTYAQRSGLLALVGSTGRLEIALKDGNASEFLSAHIGDEVSVRMQGGDRP